MQCGADDRVGHQGHHRGCDLRADHRTQGFTDQQCHRRGHRLIQRLLDHRIVDQAGHQRRQRRVHRRPHRGIAQQLGHRVTDSRVHRGIDVGVGPQCGLHFGRYRVEVPHQRSDGQRAGRLRERGHHTRRGPEVGEQGVDHPLHSGLDDGVGHQGHHRGPDRVTDDHTQRAGDLRGHHRGDLLVERLLNQWIAEQCHRERGHRLVDHRPQLRVAEQFGDRGGDRCIHPVLDRGAGLQLLLSGLHRLRQVATGHQHQRQFAGRTRERRDHPVGAEEV